MRIRYSSSFSVDEAAFLAGQTTEVLSISTRESTHVREAAVHCDIGDGENFGIRIQQLAAYLVQAHGLVISVGINT